MIQFFLCSCAGEGGEGESPILCSVFPSVRFYLSESWSRGPQVPGDTEGRRTRKISEAPDLWWYEVFVASASPYHAFVMVIISRSSKFSVLSSCIVVLSFAFVVLVMPCDVHHAKNNYFMRRVCHPIVAVGIVASQNVLQRMLIDPHEHWSLSHLIHRLRPLFIHR